MRTNMFLDPNLLKTEQELMVEELEREQALEAEATLQMESIDRMLDLQHLVSQAGSMNDGIRYSVEEHLGYVPETLELTEEGLLDSIVNGIIAFFKAIGKFISELFTGKSKSSENRIDTYLDKLKVFDEKYGKFTRANMESWYPDQLKATKTAALKAFPGDTKLQGKIEYLEMVYEKEVFKKHCAVLCLLPKLSIYGRLSSIATAHLAEIPPYEKYKEIIKNQENGQDVLYTPLSLEKAVPQPIYKTYVELFKNSGEKLPDTLGEVTEQLLKNALIGSLESQKLESYGRIFSRCFGNHPIDIMKDYQSWIDRTGQGLPKIKKELDDMVSKINAETPPGVAAGLRRLGKDVNAQIIAINFIHTLLDGLIASSTYLLAVENSVCDIVDYTHTHKPSKTDPRSSDGEAHSSPR